MSTTGSCTTIKKPVAIKCLFSNSELNRVPDEKLIENKINKTDMKENYRSYFKQ